MSIAILGQGRNSRNTKAVSRWPLFVGVLCIGASCNPLTVRLDEQQAKQVSSSATEMTENFTEAIRSLDSLHVDIRHDVSVELRNTLQSIGTEASKRLEKAETLLRAAAIPFALRQNIVPTDWHFIIRYECKDDPSKRAWEALYGTIARLNRWEHFGMTGPGDLFNAMTSSIGIGTSHNRQSPLSMALQLTPQGNVHRLSFVGYYRDFRLLDPEEAIPRNATQLRRLHAAYVSQSQNAQARGFRVQGELADPGQPAEDLILSKSLDFCVEHHGYLTAPGETEFKWYRFPPKTSEHLTLECRPLWGNDGLLFVEGRIFFCTGATSSNPAAKTLVAHIFAAPEQFPIDTSSAK